MKYVTVGDAAKQLGISPRAVQKRLHEGKLKGKKRGKSWIVDVADEAFGRDEPNGGHGDGPTISPATGGAAARPPAGPPVNPAAETRRRALEPHARVEKLGAWRELMPLCVEIVEEMARIEDAAGIARVRDIVVEKAAKVMMNLAAGFHAFRKEEKERRYQETRAAIAGTAACLRLLGALRPGVAAGIEALARRLEEAIRSVSGLVRAMEGRGGRREG